MKKAMFNKQYGLEDAVIEGKKTKTRRICKNQDNPTIEDAPWKVGEIIAVAQRYQDIFKDDEKQGILGHPTVLVRNACDTAGWSNKMFVKASSMKYYIKITDIRIERLQDISEEDCLAEGIMENHKYACPFGYKDGEGVFFWGDSPKESFSDLIDKISGKGTWKSNPWVYVYEFELAK